MRPERVSIVDETGQLLAGGGGDEAGAGAGGFERQLAFERRLREQVESIVTSVVGPNRARVQLTADFDMNRVTSTSDTFDPEGRVVRSSQSREELSSSGEKSGEVTVGNELPGAGAKGNESGNTREQSKKSEETLNYEISKTTKTEIVEGGRVKRISAAVLVDGLYNKNDKGESVYQPRPKEELDRIAALVRSAIGFDTKRGDQLEVVNLRFAEAPASLAGEPAGWMGVLDFTKADLLRGVELFIMSLLVVLVVLFVLRPLVRRIITPEDAPRLTQAAATAAPALSHEAAAAAGGGLPPVLPSDTAKMIEIAQVRGELHAQSVRTRGRVGDG